VKQLNFSSQFEKTKQKRNDPSGCVVYSESCLTDTGAGIVTSVLPRGKDAAHIRLSLVTRGLTAQARRVAYLLQLLLWNLKVHRPDCIPSLFRHSTVLQPICFIQ
jgi:hypothetical protein